jgi:hypothetical protein
MIFYFQTIYGFTVHVDTYMVKVFLILPFFIFHLTLTLCERCATMPQHPHIITTEFTNGNTMMHFFRSELVMNLRLDHDSNKQGFQSTVYSPILLVMSLRIHTKARKV